MPTSPAWKRIHVPTRDDAQKPGSDPFRDLVGSYLCGVGLSLLNSRHLAGECPLDSRNAQHVEALGDALRKVAEFRFADDWGDYDHAAGRPAHFRLDRAKVLDGASAKARWVIVHWKPEHVEGRRRGGRHGAAQGVRKGRTPRWVPAQLDPFAHLPAQERKAQAMAALGCSASTYFELWKAYRKRQEANLAAAEEAEAAERDLMELLPPELRGAA